MIDMWTMNPVPRFDSDHEDVSVPRNIQYKILDGRTTKQLPREVLVKLDRQLIGAQANRIFETFPLASFLMDLFLLVLQH